MDENIYDTWEHVSCWSCKHSRLDLDEGYYCRLTGDPISRVELNVNTDCVDWDK